MPDRGNSYTENFWAKFQELGASGAKYFKSLVYGKDGSTVYPMKVNDIGHVSVSNFMLEVAKGNVPGHSSINKFGHNRAAASGDDVWGGGGTYAFFPTTAQDMDIVSTSTDDDAGGTGAIQVTVLGLGEDWEEVSETVTLNGTTPVNLTQKFIRLFRAFVAEAGTANTNVGDITVEIQGSATVGIFIGAGDGQTQHAIYTIPAGKTAYFIKGYVAVADDEKFTEAIEFQWQARANNGVNGAWLVKGEAGLTTLGTSVWIYDYGIPAGPIPEKTDIRIKVITTTKTMGCTAGFDLLLVDN